MTRAPAELHAFASLDADEIDTGKTRARGVAERPLRAARLLGIARLSRDARDCRTACLRWRAQDAARPDMA